MNLAAFHERFFVLFVEYTDMIFDHLRKHPGFDQAELAAVHTAIVAEMNKRFSPK